MERSCLRRAEIPRSRFEKYILEQSAGAWTSRWVLSGMAPQDRPVQGAAQVIRPPHP